MAGQPALRKLSREHPALRIEPTTALVQEPSSRHEKDILIIVERKDISIKTPRLNLRDKFLAVGFEPATVDSREL